MSKRIILKNKILKAFQDGLSNSEISKQFNCSPATVSFHLKKEGLTSPKREIDWLAVQTYYDLGFSIGETASHFNINPNSISKRSNKGLFRTRSRSQAAIIQQQKSPRTHTPETKEKLRDAMLVRRANGYDWSFAHSKNNGISYPEQFWIEVIENEFEDKNYVFQYQLGRFAIDFAWPHKKIALEIDGDQHYTQEEQKNRDKNKEALLEENGWTLIRIRWKSMFKNPKPIIKEVKDIIDNSIKI